MELAKSPSAGLLLVAILCGFLTSCTSATPSNDTFGLSSTPLVQGKTRHKVQILIPEPSALKALDSEQVVIRVSDAELRYLSQAQWSDRLPKIVQAKLIQAFERTGVLGGVGRPGEGLAIDQQVLTSITSFEIATGGADSAIVEISAKVLNDRNGTIKAQKSFTSTVPANGQSNEAYIAALDKAFANVTSDLVTWSLGVF